LAPLKDVVTFESEPPPSILGDIGLLELKKAKLKVLEYGNG
jgi:hypothetical protein